MRTSSARTKRDMESDIKIIRNIMISQVVVTIVIIAAVGVGAYLLVTYLSGLFSQVGGFFNSIPTVP